MTDLLPQEAGKLRYIEQKTRELAQLYGYEEVITPILESYELLAAKAGEEMRHRMYTFKDMAGRKIALRGEFTPSIARLVATKLRTKPKPLKLFCIGSLYRYDEPQFGRSREFWQANYEIMGSNKPEADAEIITLTSHLLDALKLHNHYIKIGHVGILRGILSQERVQEAQQNRIMQLLDKKQWDQALAAAKEQNVSERCLKTVKALIETRGKDPSRVIHRIKQTVRNYDDATEATQKLQEILELTTSSRITSEILIEAGFARGLEYYTGILLEPYVPQLERAGLALGGGGRYDKLVELFGGEPTPAVGVAPGIDRIILAMDKQQVPEMLADIKRVAVISLKEEMLAQACRLASTMRQAGITTEIELMRRPVSKALSDADRRGFRYCILIGPEETKEGKVTLRNMSKRRQKKIKTEELLNEIKKD